MNEKPRVIVVDDALLVREGTTRILDAHGCRVVGTAADVAELRRVLVDAGAVDAIVLDIRMPPTYTDEGLRALEELRASGDPVGVVVLSMYASRALAERVAAAGVATGYLLKDRVTEPRMLADAVHTVASGGTVVDPEVVELMMVRTDIDDLTAQEHRVLALMAEGLSNAGIAARLFLSVKTVETHIANLTARLGIAPTHEENRRVLAVLRALGGSSR